MMLVIDALYNIGTWLLFNIYKATTTTLKDGDRLVFRIMLALVHTNTIVNPIFYFIFNRNFRVSLKLKNVIEKVEQMPNSKPPMLTKTSARKPNRCPIIC